MLRYKRLHDARFALPASGDAPGVRIDGPTLARLLDGVPRPARRGDRM